MGILHLKEIRLETTIGIHPWEKQITQPVIFDLEIPIDITRAAQHDDIRDTLDYDALIQTMQTFLRQQTFQLIETLADKMASFLMEQFSLPAITLAVYKPLAVKQAKMVGIQLTRKR